ncbi:MAG: hypothetical protein DRJ33_06695 [Candidatus Methanomethylicota archaeon]|uniref:Uncharacterized protein n=1 Tax=Thermoproteota archaeon TaxID=2056631 RepID=A0A497EV66_9CREN|nr:MAG: hypothetical protein DRJ33_06695 [Candidatus Verstraetearchaeota archaeon]
MEKKGVLESIGNFIYVIVTLSVIIILAMILYTYMPKEKGVASDAKEFAKLLLSCWKRAKYGALKESFVCKKVSINPKLKEYAITQALDCQKLPNNYCFYGNCRFCNSSAYTDQDKVLWLLPVETDKVSIEYDGGDGKLKVVPLNCNTTCVCMITCLEKASNILKVCEEVEMRNSKLNNLCKEVKNKLKLSYEECLSLCRSI